MYVKLTGLLILIVLLFSCQGFPMNKINIFQYPLLLASTLPAVILGQKKRKPPLYTMTWYGA